MPKYKLPPPSAVYFNGALIKEVSRYKYLGLLVDNQLKWRRHIHNLRSKLKGITRGLRRVVSEKWGVKTYIMRMLYHAIFILIMTYGIAIWGWRAQLLIVQKGFTKIIRNFCLMSTRCLRSTTANVVLFMLMNTSDFSTILVNPVRRVTLHQLCLYNKNNQVGSGAEEGKYKSKTMHEFHNRCNIAISVGNRDIMYDDLNEFFRLHPSERVNTECKKRDKQVAL